ncbi:hypothetical protein PM082_018316 [Marasmius tenuissimus]|nr:hypothetical protein PM082_018316 [Marasmius tenuissimus]
MSINRLPRRVLVHIFGHITSLDSDNRNQRPSIITITSVCRHWRHLAASTPEFWHHIHVPFRSLKNPSQWITRWLELSYPLGVSVFLVLDLGPSIVSSPRPSGGHTTRKRERGTENVGAVEVVDKEWSLRNELHRVLACLTHQTTVHRLLRLRIVVSPNINLLPTDALHPLSLVSAPNLRELEVSFLHHARDAAQRVIMVMPTSMHSRSSPLVASSSTRSLNPIVTVPFPFQSNPDLFALALQGCPKIPYPLRNLTSLLLANVLPTETAFLSLSHDSPSLHTLVLHNLHSSIHDGGNEVVSHIRFSRLKKLVVGYAKEPSVPSQSQYPDRHFHILPYMIIPAIEEMEIGYEEVPLQYVPDLTRMAPTPYGVVSEPGPRTAEDGVGHGKRSLRIRLDYSALLAGDWSVKESLMSEYFRCLETAGAPIESVEVAMPRRTETGTTRVVRIEWRRGMSLSTRVDNAFQ